MVSPPNSLYGRVYDRNMDETSFTGYDIGYGLSMMLANPKTAYYTNVGFVNDIKSCQVLWGYGESKPH